MSKKILLVEDEEDLAYAISMRLETTGYQVLLSNDGQDALNKARSEKPDLIILDIMLPKIDGFKVCRMLKFDEKYKRIPIIILTARAQQQDERIGYEVGANAFLTKPFEPKVLMDKIEELLKK